MSSILVTRPQPAADTLVGRLRASGYAALAGPLAEYVALPFDRPDLSAFDAVAFTSAQAVRVFGACDLPAYCVGDATALAAQEAGYRDVQSADGDARDLAKLLEQKNIRGVLHVAGADTAHDVSHDRLVVYKARLLDALPLAVMTALEAGEVGAVMLFSARAAARLTSLLPNGAGAKMTAICLSPRVATGLGAAPWKVVHVAERPTLESMIGLLPLL